MKDERNGVLMCQDKCYCNVRWCYNHGQSNLCVFLFSPVTSKAPFTKFTELCLVNFVSLLAKPVICIYAAVQTMLVGQSEPGSD